MSLFFQQLSMPKSKDSMQVHVFFNLGGYHIMFD